MIYRRYTLRASEVQPLRQPPVTKNRQPKRAEDDTSSNDEELPRHD